MFNTEQFTAAGKANLDAAVEIGQKAFGGIEKLVELNLQVTRAALDGSCPLCAQTMQIFVSILGAEAGTLALKTMATGGVFIGGGIAAKILPLLRQPALLDAFFAKGRFHDFMERIPLRVILNDRAALLGAARHALHGAEALTSR